MKKKDSKDIIEKAGKALLAQDDQKKRITNRLTKLSDELNNW